jgi:hypothetical protein
VFVARVWPTPDDAWPKELCDEAGHPPLGLWFYDRPGNVLTSRPFGWPNPTGVGGKFSDALVDLTGEIAVRLHNFNELLERKRRAIRDAAKLTAPAGQAIYVHARRNDMSRWEDACQELISAGYGVFPEAPESVCADPRQATDSEGEIVRILSACDGLLLVPGDDPRSLVLDLAVVGYQRRNLARALSHKPLPCAVIDRGLMLQGIERLRNSAKNLQIDWINASISNWTGQIKSWLYSAGVIQGGVA